MIQNFAQKFIGFVRLKRRCANIVLAQVPFATVVAGSNNQYATPTANVEQASELIVSLIAQAGTAPAGGTALSYQLQMLEPLTGFWINHESGSITVTTLPTTAGAFHSKSFTAFGSNIRIVVTATGFTQGNLQISLKTKG